MQERDELRRTLRGGLWGAAGALVMSLLMGLGLGWIGGPGTAPWAFPRSIAAQLLGREHGLGVIALGTFAHFIYGALAGVAFAFFCRPMTTLKGLGYGLFLWWIMQITFVPWLGLSDFGLLHGPGLAFAALILHLAYGLTLGMLGARDEYKHHNVFDDLGRLSTSSRA